MGGYNFYSLKSCEMYDIKENKWIEFPSMSTNRGGCCAQLYGMNDVINDEQVINLCKR
jgi:hypothetical protein